MMLYDIYLIFHDKNFVCDHSGDRVVGIVSKQSRQILPISLWSPVRLAHGLLPVIALLARHGVKADSMLDRARIERFGLMDPSYTISIEQELKFLEAAIKVLPQVGMSLEMAREYRLRGFSVLGLASQCSSSPLQVLTLMIRYPRLAWGVFDGELTFDAVTARIRLFPQSRLGAIEGFLAERDVACAFTIMEEALQAPFSLISISFRHACSGDVEDYERFFGCPVQFSAEQTELVCSRSVLEQPLPYSDASMCAFYSAQCERMSSGMDRPFSYQEAVNGRLMGDAVVPDLETLAGSMLMTGRTLQRRLRIENTSFSELLRQAREQRATKLLLDGSQSLEPIAQSLGFTDAVAFSHAFKAWTGLSPRSWRLANSRETIS